MPQSPETPLRLGIVGIGKIARDQHLPSIAASPDFTLVAAASRHATVDGCANFPTIEAMLADGPTIDAVSICTPPHGRDRMVRAALAAGKHVMIEKPPGATVAEIAPLRHHAEAAGLTLFASWHSREAAGVDAARAWLADRTIRRAAITWREDIRVWHPGQDWILEAGGFGVFDPGINALSIATAILPLDLCVDGGTIAVPENRASPIAARIAMRLPGGAPVSLDLDFLQTGQQSWNIEVETDAGTLVLTEGGKRLFVDGAEQATGPDAGEYPRLYRRFATLIRGGRSDVDLRPLQLVADAFLVSRQERVAPFDF
ncbi:Gfo/Idh/MocA family protein [Sphingomonas immobilis]|uniref:Gfo/Idh/MocA family oxidoreductase n=1 Tax=Sphingomonas immobilis TaxID=3063997 RepID=A0ABT8ZT70_9SPHN|nr:Gfo/Idh/MocA family oxidoreductase [Sphingomonas sp. CA1-15]MDO7840760.1 Gfo/Idh/MocA family oxidoreductase [Sphingomonas sp. CA1-15]